jgi:uncharacterized protein YlxP (DUF503 family)
MSEKIFVGVLRLGLRIPGARSLKDRRQAVSSLRDRVSHRFPVSVHEIDTADLPGRQVLAVTTAGNDATVIRANLDRIASFAASSALVQVSEVDVDVFRWHAPSAFPADLPSESPEPSLPPSEDPENTDG